MKNLHPASHGGRVGRLAILMFALLASIALLRPAQTSAAPAHRSAAATTVYWSETIVHLDYATMTRVTAKQHYRFAITRSHLPVIGYWKVHRRYLSPHVRVSVRYPIFQQPTPTYALPGCPASIAQWAGYIVPAARQTGVPVPELTGVMENESGGNPNAYNPSSGASGIYQFLPSTAAALGINPWVPAQAIPAAARYIAQVGLGQFSGGGYFSAWYCD